MLWLPHIDIQSFVITFAVCVPAVNNRITEQYRQLNMAILSSSYDNIALTENKTHNLKSRTVLPEH